MFPRPCHRGVGWGHSEWQSGNAASLVTALEQLSSGPGRGCGERGRGDFAGVPLSYTESSQISAAGGLWFLHPQGLFPHRAHHLVILCSMVICPLSRLWVYPWAVA